MEFAVCAVPAAAVRKRPSHKSEIVNQLLFGEAMRIVKAKRNWSKIESLHDNYEAWIRNNLLMHVAAVSNTNYVAGDLINTIIANGVKMQIPFGSGLPAFKDGAGQVGHAGYTFNGYAVDRTLVKAGEETLRQLVTPWLNAPYLWGGRTIMGVDCSGFTQVIFKMMNIDLLRDAKLQVGQGIKVKRLADSRCGDLAFFEKKKKITHVGILLSPTEIVHASGRVRIDKIDNKGIINLESGQRTHSLVHINRYW